MTTTAKTKNKGLRVAIGGAALMVLSLAFNAAAADEVATVPALDAATPAATTVTANDNTATAAPSISAEQEARNAEMVRRLNDLGARLQDGHNANILYDATQDAGVQRAIDELLQHMQSGADGNIFPQPDGIAFLGGSGMTAFAAALNIAVESGRLEIVDAFLAAGASATQVAPDAWTPMDYAISYFIAGQAANPDMAERAFALIRALENSGARIADAREIATMYGNNNPNFAFDSYEKLAINILGMDIMERAGVTLPEPIGPVLRGAPETIADLMDNTRLTRSFIESHGGRLIHETYTDAYPGGPRPHRVTTGDTMVSLATRYQDVMGERSVLHAMTAIMRLNNLGPQAPLRPGQRVLIPMPIEAQVGQWQFREVVTLRDIATDLVESNQFFRPNATIDEAVILIARLNGVAAADAETYEHPRGRPLTLPFRNDTFGHLPRLTAPTDTDPTRRVDLVIIEEAGGEDYHRKRTYGAAISSNYAINPDYDIFRFFAWREHIMDYPGNNNSPALTALMLNPHNPLRDNLVFSQSMEVSVGRPGTKTQDMDSIRQQRPDGGPHLEDTRLALRLLEDAAPILFTAAGNQYANGEGPYKQAFNAVHGPRTYVIGAAGRYPVHVNGRALPAYIMSAYSTAGADVCAPLPYFMGEQQEGTSFSTPLAAGVYRQFSEWYGHRLTTEEIMAAAMMTASRNVLDYDDPIAASRPQNPDHVNAHMAVFRTNGAGLPHHHRCGAGIIDVAAWQQGLERLVELKQTPGLNGAPLTHTAMLGAPAATPDDAGNGQYVYRFTVPQDMTAGKMTFLLPQAAGQRTDITVRMPSGFESVLPRSVISDAVSSHAFAYEDLRTGSVIEIIADQPLGPRAAMTLRGHAGDNAVARLRDELRVGGVLPAPLTTIGGEAAQLPLPPPPPGGPEIDLETEDEEIKAIDPHSAVIDPDAPPRAGERNAAGRHGGRRGHAAGISAPTRPSQRPGPRSVTHKKTRPSPGFFMGSQKLQNKNRS